MFQQGNGDAEDMNCVCLVTSPSFLAGVLCGLVCGDAGSGTYNTRFCLQSSLRSAPLLLLLLLLLLLPALPLDAALFLFPVSNTKGSCSIIVASGAFVVCVDIVMAGGVGLGLQDCGLTRTRALLLLAFILLLKLPAWVWEGVDHREVPVGACG
jgi:hypothetical protein